MIVNISKYRTLLSLDNGVTISTKLSGDNWRAIKPVFNNQIKINKFCIVDENNAVFFSVDDIMAAAIGFKSEKYVLSSQRDFVCFGYLNKENFPNVKLNWYDIHTGEFHQTETRHKDQCTIFLAGNNELG